MGQVESGIVENEPVDGSFQGAEGATSLKAEIAGRVPVLNDAATYREARRLLVELGGAEALREELTFTGFVEPSTGMLTVTDKPYNIFASLASGKSRQTDMLDEQERLGPYQSKFFICSNQRDADMHWDSNDPNWAPRASMAKRHRFLTTKDLNWHWFNALAFGLEGPIPLEAASEVEVMKAAALHYVKKSPGWSDQIGLFFNVWGHNKVNSLFLHVLDMSELGPAFKYHAHKNCPLEAVLKVLREEAVSKLLPSAPMRVSALKSEAGARLVFLGTNGATSVRDEIVARVPILNDPSGYREARRILMEELGGPKILKFELVRSGFVDNKTKQLTLGTSPFNVFARIAGGKTVQPEMETEQACLGEMAEDFMIACNRPENDEHWDSTDPAWVGKASMARRHRFLIVKDLHWRWFNPLAFGMLDVDLEKKEDDFKSKHEKIEEAREALNTAIAKLEMMKAAALSYAAMIGGWSSSVGLFFHVFGHCSVNSLHLHILDMDELGPTFWKLENKNCPLDCILKVLREEASQLRSRPFKDSGWDASRAASAAGDAAKTAEKALAVMVATAERLNRGSGISTYGDDVKDTTNHIVQLNVSGDMIDVPLSTLLLAPMNSPLGVLALRQLKEIVALGDSHPSPVIDDRIFLNYPPRSFRTLVDQLRLLHIMPGDALVNPPVVPLEQEVELEQVAWLLRLGHLLKFAFYGQKSMPSAMLGPRLRRPASSAFTCSRRRPASARIMDLPETAKSASRNP